MSDKNGSIQKNKYIMSNLFWLALMVMLIGISLAKVPILGIVGPLGLIFFLITVALEVGVIGKELEEAEIPENQRNSWWVIAGWWCILIGDPVIHGVLNAAFIIGIILIAVEVKNVSRFGVYLWVRRSFRSFILGFVIPLAIIVMITNARKVASSSGKRKK